MNKVIVAGFAMAAFVMFQPELASAQCSLPYQLTNGLPADATQVMANYNALLACITSGAPAGSVNALQYKSGDGTLGGAGPLTDGQLLIGASGSPPQAQTLTAGNGIAITNSPGGISISTSGAGAGAGLYRQIMSSPTPSMAITGFSSWLNQGTTTTSDTPVGQSLVSPVQGNAMTGLIRAVPTPPYTITVLLGATRDTNSFSGAGIGWYDGTNKIHFLSYVLKSGGIPYFEIEKWSSPTSFSANDYTSTVQGFSQPIWLRVSDDTVNVTFSFSQDGYNFLKLFSTTKTSGYLGISGYNYLFFGMNPNGGPAIGTIMSWTQN